MAENLFIRLSENETGVVVEWMLLDESSGIVRFRGEENLTRFAETVSSMTWSGETYAMLQGEEVFLTRAAIPSRQTRQIQQAVPFMVEEYIAEDVEDCHFAIGDRDGEGKVSVAVINSNRLTYWLGALKEVGISPSVLTVDALLVPYEQGSSIFFDGDRVLMRTSTSNSLSVEISLLPVTLDLLTDEEREFVSFWVHESQREQTELIVSQFNAEQENAAAVDVLEYQPFEVLCRGFGHQVMNLLQGDFKVEVQKNTKQGSWRAVAILAACAFGLHISVLLFQGIYFDVKAKDYERESRALYTEVFPDDRNVRDVKRRWRGHLGQVESGAGGGFLDLFTDTVQHLSGTSLVLNNVNFNESRGNLVLQLKAPRSDELIQFSNVLANAGLSAEIGTINQGEDSVKGSVEVKLAGGP